MPERQTCSNCGSVIPPGAPAGQCVKCLLGYGDDSGCTEQATHNLSTGQGSTLLGVGEGMVPDRSVQGAIEKGFGDYEFLSEAKEGGMGVVYRARQISLNRIVGLKMIRSGSFATAGDVQRFRMEAESAASLNHPHIVPIYEVGEHAGRHYFTMNWIEGKSLAEVMAGQRLPGSESAPARLMAKIAVAIQHAHERGILHRDLKPGNILIDRHGEPHVTDFGLAKRLESSSEVTVTGMIMGTPNYMSPEQAEGKNRLLTTASDIFSLGSILYQMLTGKTPFSGGTGLEIIKRVIETEPARPSTLNPRVDRDLETICLRCLHKDPQRRYLSASGLATDLENWLEGKPIAARPVSDWERAWKWVRRHPAVSGLSAAVLISILVGFLAVSWQWRQTSKTNVRLQSQRADNFLAADKAYLALDTLAQMIRKDPYNRMAAEHLINLLNQRIFWLLQTNSSSASSVPVSPSTDSISLDFVTNAHTAPIRSLEFSRDGQRVISASSDTSANATAKGTAKVWDVRKESLLLNLTQEQAVTSAEFSPDGSMIVTATEAPNAVARLWDASTGSPTLANPIFHAHTINKAHFSPNGKLVVTASDDGTARIWYSDTGVAYSEPVRLAQAIDDARLSIDGNELMVTTNGIVQSYRRSAGLRYFQAMESEMPDRKSIDARTQQLEAFTSRLRSKYSAEITCLDLSTNSGLLASASSDKSARLWNAKNLQPIGIPMIHDTTVNCARFSPDGRRLVTSTAGPITRVRIWDVETGQPLTDPIPSLNDLAVAAVQFSSDGSWIITDAGWKWRLYPISGSTPIWLAPLATVIADMPDERSIATMTVPENLRKQMLDNVQHSLRQDSSELAAWAKDLLRGSR
jgi:eukaryotic-like serine/threonine-protein kinase